MDLFEINFADLTDSAQRRFAAVMHSSVEEEMRRQMPVAVVMRETDDEQDNESHIENL